MNEDPAHSITIPLQPVTTVTDTHHGAVLEIPANIWRAIDIWYRIKSDDVAAKVGKVIQARLDRVRESS